jgi:hypothetical protein
VPHLHSPSMEWTGCTVNYRKSMPLPLRSSQSVLAGVRLAQLPPRFKQEQVGQGSPQGHPRQGWHHHLLPTSHPWPCYGGNTDGVTNPRFITNLTRVTQACCPIATSRARDKAGRATSLEARSRSRAASPPSTQPTVRQTCTAPHRRARK